MPVPHRQSPNRARELRERVIALVRLRVGARVICARCGARYATMDERCEADLGQSCPGQNALALLQRQAEAEVGLS